MVFTQILIARGMVYKLEDFKDEKQKNAEKDGKYDDEPFECVCCDQIIPEILQKANVDDKQVMIYTWSCCSDIRDKYIFVGYHMFSINRVPTQRGVKTSDCKNCTAFVCCNQCIGKMDNKEVHDVIHIDNNICQTETLSQKYDVQLKKINKIIGKTPAYFGTFKLLDDCLSCS